MAWLKVSLPSLAGTAGGTAGAALAFAVEGFFCGAFTGFAAAAFFTGLAAFAGARFFAFFAGDFFGGTLLVLAFFFMALTTILLNKRRKYVQCFGDCQAGLWTVRVLRATSVLPETPSLP